MAASALVVGAGRSGLLAARMLAREGLAVTLVERLPAAGGQEPEPAASGLAKAARRAGVDFVLGTLAVSLSGPVVETLGIGGAGSYRPDALVVATGTRPATVGELGVTGDRCAGILPGSAMIHLVESGVLPGWRPVVLGGGDLARHCAELCLRAGAHAVSVVSPAERAFAAGPGMDTGAACRPDRPLSSATCLPGPDLPWTGAAAAKTNEGGDHGRAVIFRGGREHWPLTRTTVRPGPAVRRPPRPS